MKIKKAREDLRKGKTIYDMNLKVAYYGRVSTDKDDQLNSLENQQNYFEDMIKENSNWIFTRGYIDEGISGTAVKNRDSFLKMIEDATLGKIDLILTKEISRFSRNTVDSIKYTEYLLKQGVIVYFLSDNLNTIQEDAEFRLTIMSSMAQDEVRKLSERVKFGINRMIKDRKLIGGNLTGYYKKNGIYEINPNEAPLIKYLFTTYASGSLGLKKIGEELAQLGYLNSKGKPYSQTALAKMLSNPRYKDWKDFGYKGVCNDVDIVLSEIPEWQISMCRCNLYYNRNGWKEHCKDYNSYQTWLKERNTQRYIDVQNHGQKIDGKNMLHCTRLLQCANDILTLKTINVRVKNPEYLLSIRHGKVSLEELLESAKSQIKELKQKFEDSDLPDSVDQDLVRSILNEIRKESLNLF